MSPSVVSGEGDGLLAAEEGNWSCFEFPLCSKKFPLCSKELVAVGVRGGLLRIDVGELFPETGVVLSLKGGGRLTFFQWGQACNSLSIITTITMSRKEVVKGKDYR